MRRTTHLPGPRLAVTAVTALALLAGCGGGATNPNAVAPQGAPFSFDKPDAFSLQPILAERAMHGGNQDAHGTAVALDVYNSITVISYPLQHDTSTMSEDELRQQLEPALQALSAPQRQVSTVQRHDVPAGRALSFEVADTGTQQVSRLSFVFTGRLEVEVACQWADKEKAVTSGCDHVLQTLKITGT